MEHHQGHELVGKPYVDEDGVGDALDALHDSDVVHVPLHEMPAQPVTETHGALEIHTPPRVPVADRRAAECGHHSGNNEPAGAGCAHRETGAVHRDALATGQPGVTRRDTELTPHLRPLDPLDDADVVYQSGEQFK